MAAYTWPATLPQNPQGSSYNEANGVLIIRTPVDQGPAKMRRRGVRPDVFQLAFRMTTAQVAILDDFIENTIKGTARFDFTHPRTLATTEVRFVPQQDGLLYQVSFVSDGYWDVSMMLENVP